VHGFVVSTEDEHLPAVLERLAQLFLEGRMPFLVKNIGEIKEKVKVSAVNHVARHSF
jgi:hypothetical protein